MTDLVKNSTADHAIALLNHYSFDLESYPAEQFVQQWVGRHPSRWVRAAVIEALYQGRYKAVSVSQILAFWQRRGEPLCHFNYEFERIICSSSPQNLTAQSLPEIREPNTMARRVERKQPQNNLAVTSLPTPEPAPLSPAQEDSKAQVPAGFGPEPAARVASSLEQATPQFDQSEVKAITPAPASALDIPPLAPATVAQSLNGSPASPLEEIEGSSSLAASGEEFPPEAAPPELESLEREQQEIPLQVFQSPPEEEPWDIYQINWSRSEASKYPIHQFVPTSATSDFHEKLKAVAQRVKG